jgi:hypothetical protein
MVQISVEGEIARLLAMVAMSVAWLLLHSSSRTVVPEIKYPFHPHVMFAEALGTHHV